MIYERIKQYDMNRRELLKNVATGTATLFIVPAAITSCEEDLPEPDNNNDPDNNSLSIDLTKETYSQLGTAGGSVIVSGIIIANTGDRFIALSSACTHSGCTVSYDISSGNLPCPCHGSIFSAAGAVLNGPAETPLKVYTVSQEGDMLTIPR